VSRSILEPATTRIEWGIDPTMAADRQIGNVAAVWARMPGAAQVSLMLAPHPAEMSAKLGAVAYRLVSGGHDSGWPFAAQTDHANPQGSHVDPHGPIL
jgi:hypothetical protein